MSLRRHPPVKVDKTWYCVEKFGQFREYDGKCGIELQLPYLPEFVPSVTMVLLRDNDG